MRQVFILSPAKTTGQRAQLLSNPNARFPLARQLQAGEAQPLANVFSFLSGLYFRGKVTYARAFSRPPGGVPGALVITSNRGLLPAETPITLREITAFSDVPIDPDEPRYLGPLTRDATQLARRLEPNCAVVFLGSIGTQRYVEPLLQAFGEQLRFPAEFVGRGDMSRGGLLLRATSEERELEYVGLHGAVRHGKRPAKLPPRAWGFKILEGTTPIRKSR